MTLLKVNEGDLSRSAALTLPPWFADRLHINVHSDVLLRSLLTAVERCHRDPVALLLLVAQALGVSDVTWGKGKKQSLTHYSKRNKSLWMQRLLSLKQRLQLKNGLLKTKMHLCGKFFFFFYWRLKALCPCSSPECVQLLVNVQCKDWNNESSSPVTTVTEKDELIFLNEPCFQQIKTERKKSSQKNHTWIFHALVTY